MQTWTAPVPLREFDAVRQRVTDAVDGCFSRVFSQCPGDMHTPLWPSSACRLYLPRPLLTSNSSPIETQQPYPVAACDAHRRTSHHLAIRVAAADLLFTYAPVADRITASVRHFREGEAARKLGRVDCLRAVCEGVAGAHHTLYVHLSQRAQGLAPPASTRREKKSGVVAQVYGGSHTRRLLLLSVFGFGRACLSVPVLGNSLKEATQTRVIDWLQQGDRWGTEILGRRNQKRSSCGTPAR